MRRLLALLAAALLAGCSSRDPAQLPLSEDFSDACDWPTRWDGARLGECADGAYRFELDEPGGPYTAWREVEPSSFEVEVEVTADVRGREARAGHAFGVGCWTDVAGSGFVFVVWGDGTVYVYEESPSAGLTPIFEQTTPLPAFRLPARLRAGCNGGPDGARLTFSVNGAAVRIPATSRPTGAFSVVGFVTGTETGRAAVTFDDLAARRPA